MRPHAKSVVAASCFTKEQIKTIIVLGENGVGKSSILKMLTKKVFDAKYQSTIVANYYQKEIKIMQFNKESKVVLSIWDTNGQEKIQTSLPQYLYKTCDYFIIVISYDNRDSLDYISDFINLIRKLQPNKTPPVLVIANKSDEKDKYFFFKDVLQALDDYRETIHLSQISAKNEKNVDNLFQQIALFLTGNNSFEIEESESNPETSFFRVKQTFKIYDVEDGIPDKSVGRRSTKPKLKKGCC